MQHYLENCNPQWPFILLLHLLHIVVIMHTASPRDAVPAAGVGDSVARKPLAVAVVVLGGGREADPARVGAQDRAREEQ